MKVKICGITRLEDIQILNQVKPDFVGFVFAPSTRQVTIPQAKKLMKHLDKKIKTVGVFVNPTEDELNTIQTDLNLDYFQLHGDESIDFALKYPGKIIKAFPSDSPLSYTEQINFPAEYLLIDSPRKKYYGGTGERFNWKKLPLDQLPKNRLILAGGISSDNIEEVWRVVQPMMVDVSSSVESNGIKDPAKIAQFVHAVRQLN